MGTGVTPNSVFILDEETGKQLTVKQTALKLGMDVRDKHHNERLYGWVTNNGCTTLAKCEKRQKFLKKYPGGKKHIIYQTMMGPLTAREIVEIVYELYGYRLATYTVSKRAKGYGQGTIVMFFPRLKKIEFRKMSERISTIDSNRESITLAW